MVVGAKVCDLTEDLLWFVCGLYVGILTSSLRKPKGSGQTTPSTSTLSTYAFEVCNDVQVHVITVMKTPCLSASIVSGRSTPRCP